MLQTDLQALLPAETSAWQIAPAWLWTANFFDDLCNTMLVAYEANF